MNGYRSHLIVLIETQWNVKYDMKKLNAERQKVLIETQWNVKRNPVEIHGNTYCINRNIVECKDGLNGKDGVDGKDVLIETQWNVKLNENTKAMTELTY